MAYSRITYTGTGSTVNYPFPFTYIDKTDIYVFVDGVSVAFAFLNTSTVSLTQVPIAGSVVQVRRVTQKLSAPVVFTDGSVLLKKDLDLLSTYTLFIAQEDADYLAGSVTQDTLQRLDAQSLRIINLAPGTGPTDAVNKAQNDATVLATSASASKAASAASSAAASAVLAQSSGSAVALQATLTSSSGAANVGVIAAGIGAVKRTLQDKQRDTVSVKDYDAVGDGIADDTAAFQAVYNTASRAGMTIKCLVPQGTYLLNTTPSISLGSVIFCREPNVTFTGAGTLPFTVPSINNGFKIGTGLNPTGAQGGIARLDAPLKLGDTSVGLFANTYGGSITDAGDAVLFGCYAVDNPTTVRAWSQNTNIVKTQVSTTPPAYACGIEVSAQNKTTTTGAPNSTNCLMGFFASYIGTNNGENKASAGFTLGGNGASAIQGWNYGLWIDNLAGNGVGISIRNTSGPNVIAAAGIDMRSHAGAFSGGAILLGNNHTIRADDTGATSRLLLNLDPSNYLQIGDVGISGGTVINTTGLLLPNILSQATASPGGAAALPTNPVGYILVVINGVTRKIPYYGG